MPIRSSRSWFWPGLLAVVLAFTGLGIAVDRIADRADDRSTVPAGPIPEPAMLDPDPIPVQPEPSPLGKARRVYRDRFAGFAFTIPKNWVEFRFFNFSVAPDQPSMLVYQYNGGGPQRHRYSVTLLVSQVESAERSARDARAQARASGARVAARTTTISGRPAEIVTERPTNCDGCVMQHVSVQWDDGTSITFFVSAGEENVLRRYREATWKMIRSLRHLSRDRSADEVEAFLDARVAGRGARPWLTRKAWKHFDIWGLYKGGERGNVPEDIKGYTVLNLERKDDRVTVTVSSMGIETLVFGPGRNIEGQRRSVVVLKADMTLAPGTS